MSQTIKAVMYCKHVVALEETNPDSWTDRSVHSRTRGSDVHDGNVDITLAVINSHKRQNKYMICWDIDRLYKYNPLP